LAQDFAAHRKLWALIIVIVGITVKACTKPETRNETTEISVAFKECRKRQNSTELQYLECSASSVASAGAYWATERNWNLLVYFISIALHMPWRYQICRIESLSFCLLLIY